MILSEKDRERYIRSLASQCRKPIEQIELEVERNPEILEGWVEHLENDFEDTSSYRKHYRNTYYE